MNLYAKDINLIIISDLKPNKLKKKIIISFICILGISIGSFYFLNFKYTSQINKVENEKNLFQITYLEEMNFELNKNNEIMKKIKQKQDALSFIDSQKIDVIGFFEVLKKYLPNNITIEDVTIDSNGSINLSFKTTSFLDLMTLFVKLDESKLFEEVNLNEFPNNPENSIITFALKLKTKIATP